MRENQAELTEGEEDDNEIAEGELEHQAELDGYQEGNEADHSRDGDGRPCQTCRG
jgi:hypothetical protein